MPLTQIKFPHASSEPLHATTIVEAKFTIIANADPSTLPRIIENFALRNLIPHAIRSDCRNEKLNISVQVYPLNIIEAKHLQQRMSNIIHVLSVDLEITG